MKGSILRFQGRTEEAVAGARARARPGPVQRGRRRRPGLRLRTSGNSTKALNISTRRFWLSPYDPLLAHCYGGKAWANFGLKRYDQAIEAARQAIAINPTIDVQYTHATLVAALALTGHDAEAREALQRYLALPSTGPLKTIAALKALLSPHRAAVHPASRRTSGCTTACAKQGCRRSERSRFGRRRPRSAAGSSASGGEACFALAME